MSGSIQQGSRSCRAAWALAFVEIEAALCQCLDYLFFLGTISLPSRD